MLVDFLAVHRTLFCMVIEVEAEKAMPVSEFGANVLPEAWKCLFVLLMMADLVGRQCYSSKSKTPHMCKEHENNLSGSSCSES